MLCASKPAPRKASVAIAERLPLRRSTTGRSRSIVSRRAFSWASSMNRSPAIRPASRSSGWRAIDQLDLAFRQELSHLLRGVIVHGSRL